jgi:hypothetical protein
MLGIAALFQDLAEVRVAMAGRQVPAACAEPGCSTLVLWAERSGGRRGDAPARGSLRFVFYGRVSTEDWQDPESSRARQREQAGALVRGHGQVVAEFFDVGESRAVAWARRPQAASLVAALADPDRGWDALVVGEYERAFYGSQYAPDGAVVRALRGAAVDAGGGRPGRLRVRA